MTIRLRLALWYGFAIAATLAVVGVLVWVRFAGDMTSSLQEALAVQVADTTAALDTGDRRNPLREDPARPGIFTLVLDRSGRVAAASRSAPAGITDVPLGSSVQRPPGATADVALYAAVGRDGVTVVAGSSLGPIAAEQERLAGLLLVSGTIAAGASLAGGWLLARRALAPVAVLVDEADRIHAADGLPGHRLHAPNANDELGRLAATLNRMLDRVEGSLHRQRSFVAAASHDLRTPITALRTELELALRPGATAEELRGAVAEALGDVRRLAGLADDLLGLAAAEPEGRAVSAEPVALRGLVEQVAGRVAAAVPAGTPVELEVEDATVVTDRVRFEQALANLVQNAVRHSPPGSPVTVRARCVAGPSAEGALRPTVDVDVLDRGPGVPEPARGLLFVPFARSAERGPGAGLGLATADAAVRALGGRIGYRDRPGGGAWFWFRVPTTVAG